MVGSATPATFVFRPMVTVEKTEIAMVNSIVEMEFSSSTDELSFLYQNQFPSSTEDSEAPLSEAEVRKRTDPELFKPIPGPDLKTVAQNWGEKTKLDLEKLLLEYDELFMKHKADIGRCKIAKHRIEVEPDAIPHREGARRMSPEKADKANNEVQNLLALGMIQPSFSPWASGIVMVKKKGGELRFCCDFRP